MTDHLVMYCKNKEFDQGDDLINLYNDMVKGLSTKLNPLKYALITVRVSRQFTNIEEAIEFL